MSRIVGPATLKWAKNTSRICQRHFSSTHGQFVPWSTLLNSSTPARLRNGKVYLPDFLAHRHTRRCKSPIILRAWTDYIFRFCPVVGCCIIAFSTTGKLHMLSMCDLFAWSILILFFNSRGLFMLQVNVGPPVLNTSCVSFQWLNAFLA